MDEKELQALQERAIKLEQEKKALEAEKVKLEDNVRNQNQYITKLEQDRKAGTQDKEPLDPATKAYLQKKMREDTIAGTLQKLTPQFPVGTIGALREDLDKFLDATMKPENTTEAYIREALFLCYGKAMANKDHAVHKLLQEQNPVIQNPIAQGAQQPILGQVPAGPLPSERLKNIGNIPVLTPNPTMNPGDVGGAPIVPPGSQGVAPRDTAEALRGFKARLGSLNK